MGDLIMNNFRNLVCAAALLAACSPPAPKNAAQADAAASPQPSAELAAAFPNCQWGEVTSADLSIWSYTCPNDRLVADEALLGFQRETTDASGKATRLPVIRIFAKPADAPLDAVLAQVRAASPGGEACTIEPGSHGDWVFIPTGEAMAAYTRFVEGKADGPSMPCGPLGPREAGGVVFRLIEGAPDKVAMIDFPSDIAIFDADTLRARPAAN